MQIENDTALQIQETPTDQVRRTLDLSGFTGTENYYSHFLKGIVLSDGAHYLTENGCAWLIDAIASHQTGNLSALCEGFQSWTLTCYPNNSATLVCTNGNDKEFVRESIGFTDCPLGEIKIFVQPTSINDKQVECIFLASEY